MVQKFLLCRVPVLQNGVRGYIRITRSRALQAAPPKRGTRTFKPPQRTGINLAEYAKIVNTDV
jgi:hypothetical protein